VIDVTHFVADTEVDPLYFDQPLLAGAGRQDGERDLPCPRRGDAARGKAGIGRLVLFVARAPRGC